MIRLSPCAAWKLLADRKGLSLLLALLARTFAYAAFEDTGTGARPTALGDTYVALGDDTQSLMVNPAGLAKMDGREATSEYSRLYSGLTDGSNIGQYYFGYGQRIKYGGTVALGWKQLSLDSLYTERTISLGYGEWITDRVAIGFAAKQLYHEYGIPNTIVDNSGNVTNGTPNFFQKYGNSNSAYSTDIGILAKIKERYTLGISIQDLNEPNIALSNEYRRIVPRTTRIGVAYKVSNDLQLAGALMMHQELANQTDYTWTGSAEKWWVTQTNGTVGWRGSVATGSRDFNQIATGPAYRLGGFQLDYTLVFNLTGITLGDTTGTHRFSMSYRFGPPKPGPIVPKTKRKPARPVDTTAAEPDIADLEDNPPPAVSTATAVAVSSASTPAPAAAPVPAPAVVTPQPPKPTELQGAPAPKPITVRPRIPAGQTATGGGIPETYIVRNGDTLESIAKHFYGDAEYWRDIYALNGDRLGSNGDLIPGQLLVLPRKEAK